MNPGKSRRAFSNSQPNPHRGSLQSLDRRDAFAQLMNEKRERLTSRRPVEVDDRAIRIMVGIKLRTRMLLKYHCNP